MPDVTKCVSCKAQVIFVPSITTGKSMILNAEPDPEGNTILVDGKGKVLSGDLFEAGVPAGTPRYKSHWATCPDAVEWRAKQKAKRNKGMR